VSVYHCAPLRECAPGEQPINVGVFQNPLNCFFTINLFTKKNQFKKKIACDVMPWRQHEGYDNIPLTDKAFILIDLTPAL
jgi:hypothetical protein